MKIKPRIYQQKWQLEHHNVSNYYINYPNVVEFVEKCMNQLRPK